MKMRVAIALLVSDEVCNQMAQVSMRCREYGFGLRVLRLPAHVSLKQPFMVNDFARFEEYFAQLAARLEAQELCFDGYRFWGDATYGVVTAHVAPNPRLRQLHTQLNRELAAQFGETQAEYDGDAYEFHLTVALGPCHPDRLSPLQADLPNWESPKCVVATRLALFVYEETTQSDLLYGVREYGTYQVLPLRDSHPQA